MTVAQPDHRKRCAGDSGDHEPFIRRDLRIFFGQRQIDHAVTRFDVVVAAEPKDEKGGRSRREQHLKQHLCCSHKSPAKLNKLDSWRKTLCSVFSIDCRFGKLDFVDLSFYSILASGPINNVQTPLRPPTATLGGLSATRTLPPNRVLGNESRDIQSQKQCHPPIQGTIPSSHKASRAHLHPRYASRIRRINSLLTRTTGPHSPIAAAEFAFESHSGNKP